MKKNLIIIFVFFSLLLISCNANPNEKIITGNISNEKEELLEPNIRNSNLDINELDVIEEKTGETQIEETPVEETPVDDIPVEETPIEETPVKETPIEETSVEKTLIEETPVEKTPIEETPAEKTPIEETPVEETPIEETPVEETPKEIKKKVTIDKYGNEFELFNEVILYTFDYYSEEIKPIYLYNEFLLQDDRTLIASPDLSPYVKRLVKCSIDQEIKSFDDLSIILGFGYTRGTKFDDNLHIIDPFTWKDVYGSNSLIFKYVNEDEEKIIFEFDDLDNYTKYGISKIKEPTANWQYAETKYCTNFSIRINLSEYFVYENIARFVLTTGSGEVINMLELILQPGSNNFSLEMNRNQNS